GDKRTFKIKFSNSILIRIFANKKYSDNHVYSLRKIKKMKTFLLFILTWSLLIFISCKKDTPVIAPVVIGALNIPASSVILNPSGFNPLAATVNYSSDTSGRTKIIVEGKHGPDSDIEHWFEDNGKVHSVAVIGLYG